MFSCPRWPDLQVLSSSAGFRGLLVSVEMCEGPIWLVEKVLKNMIGSEEKREKGGLTLPLDYNCAWHVAHLAFMTTNACMHSIFTISLSRAVDSIRHCLPHIRWITFQRWDPVGADVHRHPHAHEAWATFRTELPFTFQISYWIWIVVANWMRNCILNSK